MSPRCLAILLTTLFLAPGVIPAAEPMALQLRSPGIAFEPGQELRLEINVSNPTDQQLTGDVYMALELGGEFLFWPNFTPEPAIGQTVTVQKSQELTIDALAVNYSVPVAVDTELTWYAVAIDAGNGEVLSPVVSRTMTLLAEPLNLAGEQRVNVKFDLDRLDEDFYAVPFPNDLRINDRGVVDLSSYPNPTGNFWVNMVTDMTADERTGFALNSPCLFQFDGPVAFNRIAGQAETLYADNPHLYLVNIEPGSPEYGRRTPLKAWYWEDEDPHMPGGHVLSVAPYWGATLLPNTTYACVLSHGLKDHRNRPVGTAPAFQRIMAGVAHTPEEARAVEVYQPLVAFMDQRGMDTEEVLAAAVFTTWHPTGRFKEVYDKGVANYAADLNTPFTLTRVEQDYYVLEGAFDMPQFQTGLPPFNSGGILNFDEDGVPVRLWTQKAKAVLTIPRSTMPAEGFPLCTYIHGSGGRPIDLVDRGRRPAPGASKTRSEGPARYLAQAGMAAIAISMPVNPERLPDPDAANGFDYLNFVNFRALRGNFRQGTIELGLLLRYMSDLRLNVANMPDALPNGGPLRFNGEKHASMGQSMGAMYTSFYSALEPAVDVAIPTGAGGYWPLMLMYISLLPGRDLLNTLLWVNNPDLNEYHPVLAIGQHALEHVDPVVTIPHIMRRPLEGAPPSSVYYAAGYIDTYFHPPIISAYALSMGLPMAGEIVDSQLREDLSMVGVGYQSEYPVANNVVSRNGEILTGAIVQYEEDDIESGHMVTFQLDGPKHQYRCFLKSWLETGTPVVYAPAGVDAPCP